MFCQFTYKWCFDLQPGSSKSVLANNKHPSGVEGSASTSQEDISTASTSNIVKSSLIPIINTRRQSRTNNSEICLSTEKITHTLKRSSKQKHNISEIEASSSQESITSSSIRDSYKHKLRNTKTRRELEESRSRSRTDSKYKNHQETTRKSSTERYWKKNNRTSSTSENSTASTITANQEVTHKYPLRNRLSSSATIAQNNLVFTQDKIKKKSIALGASTSHQATREEQEPSRLTRSGAVLRRSTRNSKGKFIPILPM